MISNFRAASKLTVILRPTGFQGEGRPNPI